MSFKEAMKHRDVLVARVQVVKAEGFKTTVRCHQCDPAPCCNVCPTGALQQEEDGRITMRVQFCVACKMCIAACPYGTISLDTIGMPDLSGSDAETLAQRARREVAVRSLTARWWKRPSLRKNPWPKPRRPPGKRQAGGLRRSFGRARSKADKSC